MDDILEIVNKDCIDQLTQHINEVDQSGSIKFTYEKEVDGKLPFLDTLIVSYAKRMDRSSYWCIENQPTLTSI